LDLEKKCYILSPRNELHLRIFISVFCVGCLFGKLITSNKLQLSQRIFAVYRTLTASCFIDESERRNVLENRCSNHLYDFSDVFGISLNILLSLILHMHQYAYWWWLYRRICLTTSGFLCWWSATVFIFQK